MRAPSIVLAGLMFALPAAAHLVPPGQGQLRLDDDGAFLIASLPVRLLDGCDDDGDGLLSLDELAAHRASIQAQVDAALVITGDDGLGTISFEDLLLPHSDEQPTPSAHVTVMRRTRLALPHGPVTIRAPYLARWADERLTLQVNDGDRKSLVPLDHATLELRLRGPAISGAMLLAACVVVGGLVAFAAFAAWRRARVAP